MVVERDFRPRTRALRGRRRLKVFEEPKNEVIHLGISRLSKSFAFYPNYGASLAAVWAPLVHSFHSTLVSQNIENIGINAI